MVFTLAAAALAALLLLGMQGCLDLGRRAGRRRLARFPEAADGGPLDTAVFALFGLLIAFTFQGATSRFDARRELVVRETNAIGTAYLRVDLLPAAVQPELRALFRRYVESRLAAHRLLPDLAAARAELDRGAALQGEIWKASTSAALAHGNPGVITLVLQSLNEMIDVTTTRLAATRMHPPLAVYLLLCGMGLAASLLAGFSMARGAGPDWVRTLVFTGAVAASVYVILDMEFPRLGLIRVDAFDRLLVDLLASMK
jgi:hypothetical protein